MPQMLLIELNLNPEYSLKSLSRMLKLALRRLLLFSQHKVRLIIL